MKKNLKDVYRDLSNDWLCLKAGLQAEVWWKMDNISNYMDAAKGMRERKKEEKSEVRKAEKAAKKAYKESQSEEFSEEMTKNIYKMADKDTSKRVGIFQKALDGQKLVQYAYWYMTDEKATLVKRSQTEREIINSIASYFGFGRIYDSAGVIDLRIYDPSYENEYFELSKYIFCINDFIKKSEDKSFMERLNNRQKQLFGEDYLEKKAAAEKEKAKQEERLKRKENSVRQEENSGQEEHFRWKPSKELGYMGEADVEYTLKFLPSEYRVIEKGEKGIHLFCPSVVDESQEIDHIVVSPQGVFLIETKNYSGEIVIDEQGNWIRHKLNGERFGEENPARQVYRHHRVVEGILGKVDICDVVCIANSKAILEGVEHSPVPVIKADMLLQYFSDYKNESGKEYGDEEIEEIVRKIEEHRVKKSKVWTDNEEGTK